MAANADKLSNSMLSMMRSEMKKINSSAKEMPFQEIYTKAVSKGVVETLKELQSKGGGSGGATGLGKGIVMNLAPMVEKAKTVFTSMTGGSSGPAMEPILKAILGSIVIHFASDVEIKSISGYGGTPPPPVGGTPDVIYNLIKKSLPYDLAKSMEECQIKGGLTKAISEGLSFGLSNSKPNAIPSSGDPGALVAIYK